jgi:hypothetical protein
MRVAGNWGGSHSPMGVQMDKFQPLRDAGTNGANYDLDTEDVIKHLKGWDEEYDITLADVEHDRVLVTFKKVPKDVAALAADIYEFCPDTVDQHFGCIAELVEMTEETGDDLPPHIAELIDGVDLGDEQYGVELLRRSVARNKLVALWWD